MQHLFKVKNINDHTLHFAATFLGKLDLERFRKAVNISATAFPLIRCRFKEDKRQSYWEDKGYTAEDMVELLETQNVNECLTKYICEEIDTFNGPQLKIKVIRYNKIDTLCVLINHMLCDAAGFKDYLYMLSDIYRNMESKTDYYRVAIGNRKIEQILKAFSVKDKLKILFVKNDMSTHDTARFELEGDLSSPLIEIRRINRESFCLLKAYAKKHGATVNDVMLTAYMRILFQLFGRTVMIPCTADLRKYLPNHRGYGICNLCTNLNCGIGAEIGVTFEQTLYKVKQVMDKQKSDIACGKSLILMEKVFDIFPYKIASGIVEKKFVNAPIAFTNIGIIDKNRLDFGKVEITEAYMTGSIKYSPYFQLAVSTFDDQATLSINLYATHSDKNKISIFLDKFVNELIF